MSKFRIKQIHLGGYYWELCAPNGQVIARSENNYTSFDAVKNGISAVKKYAETAEIEIVKK